MIRSLARNQKSVGRWLAIALGVFFIVLFLVLVVGRITYPFEIASMEGSIVLHAARIVEGKQLYVAPSIEFVDWLYQPLFYYATAAAIKTGAGVSFFAGRSVSLCSTFLSCAILWFVIFKITRKNYEYAFLGGSLFLATFGVTGYTFDLARIDPLMLCFLAAASVCLIRSYSIGSIVLSAFFLALAIFTKQQAFIYIIPIAVWLWLQGHSKAYIFLGVLIVFFTAGTVLFVGANPQWYLYYVYTIPAAKAQIFGYGRMIFALSEYVFANWAIGSVFIIGASIYAIKKNIISFKEYEGLLIFLWIVSIIQLALHMGDQMSYKNIALPFAFFSAILLPIVLYRMEQRTIGQAIVPWVFVLQFFAFLYNPFREPLGVVKQSDREFADEYLDSLRVLPGNIITINHQLLTEKISKPSYANLLAMQDVYMTGDTTAKRLKAEWEKAFASHSFEAVLQNDPITLVNSPIEDYYFSRMMYAPNRQTPFFPCFVFVPHKHAR